MPPQPGFWARVLDFRQRYQAPEGLFWIKRVNHSAGALIAYLLLRTAVTPNALTVGGLVGHVTGALLVAFAPVPIPLWTVIAVALAWQLAFSLDCADGPLARARRQTTAFGAWFDQMADSISRTAVYTALIVYLVRALDLPAVPTAIMTASVVSLALLQTFSSWQRASALGRTSPIEEAPAASRSALRLGQQLVDYGAFLALAAVLPLWPAALLVFVVFLAMVNALFVLSHLAISWRRHGRA